ncbi:MAG: site-2 protease family protein [Anaerolineae bacterium]|nr:site-2 protease family protein [Anaerolineae bacterium]
MDPLTLIAFILILSLLVFVHELGHFIVAKRAGIVVEEFAIGFPPRAVKLWQEGGRITLDGHEYEFDRKLSVSRHIQPGAQVYAETAFNEQGRPIVTKLELIKPVEGEAKGPEPKRGLNLPKLFARWRFADAGPVDERPSVTVDAVTRPTEYAINWIPFGGYVKMLGEEDPTAPGSFASKSKKIRFAVLVAGSTMNLLLAVAFFTLTALSGVPETAIGTIITKVAPNSPAATADLQAGDVIVGADEVQFKYDGELVDYVNKTKGTEITLHLERNGETFSSSLTPRTDPPEGQGAMGVTIMYVPVAKIVITEVLPDTPAAAAGLQPGEIIVGADDVKFKYAGDLAKFLEKNQGRETTLYIEQEGKIRPVSLTPNAIVSTEEITPLGVPIEHQEALGLKVEYDFETKLNHLPLPQAFISGVSQTAQLVGLTFYVPIALIRNLIPAEAARVTGPVGIYQQTGSAVQAAITLNWWFPVLWWIAALSTALAVTNLLPLPALDGGRILFVVIEAIRGKRVSPEKEGAIHFIGLALLLSLMILISYYDISNPLPTIDWANFF